MLPESIGRGPYTRLDHLIYEIRGTRVMIDRDLAGLYGVETRVLNQAVQRNLERFPDDFSFLLTRQEVMRISQLVISSQVKFAKRVRAFAEPGVAMLSSVLRSPRAIRANIEIMRAFTRVRRLEASHAELARQFMLLRQHVDLHNEQISSIMEAIRQLIQPQSRPGRQIGFHAPRDQPAEHGDRG